MSIGPIGRIWAVLGIDATTFEAGLTKAQKGLKRAGRQLDYYGKELTKSISLPLAGVGAIALKMSVDFNKAMANVATLIPGSTERVQELKKAVQGLAVDTGKSTQDLADGLYQVISAFGDTADTVKILEINAKAAVGGLATTKEAIDLTSAVTKAYGDTSAVAVQKVADLAQMAVKLGQTTFPELAAAIGKVTPLSKTLGVSMEEMFAVFAAATGVTGKAAEVSTQLRGFMQALLAPTKDLQNLMKGLGYKTGFAMIQSLGLGGAFGKVVDEAAKTGTPLQKYIGQIEGMTAALSIGKAQADDYIKKYGEMNKATGESTKAFIEQTQGINKLGFAFAVLGAKMQVMAQNLGDSLGPALITAFDALTPWIDGLGKLSAAFAAATPEMQKLVVGIAAAFAITGPAMMALSKFATLVAAILAPGTGTVVLAIAGGVAVIGGVIWGLVQVFSDTFNELRNIGEVFKAVWKNLCDWLPKTWEEAWNRIATFLSQKLDTIKKTITATKNFVVGAFSDMATELVFQSIVPDMTSQISKHFSGMSENISKSTKKAKENVIKDFLEMVQFTVQVCEIMGDAAEKAANRIGDALHERNAELIRAAQYGADWAEESIRGVDANIAQLEAKYPSLPKTPRGITQPIETPTKINLSGIQAQISSSVGQGITGAIQGRQADFAQIGLDLAGNFINKFVEWGTSQLVDIFNSIGQTLINAGTNTGLNIMTGAEAGGNFLVEAGNAVANMFISLFNSMASKKGGGGIFGSIIGGIASIGGALLAPFTAGTSAFAGAGISGAVRFMHGGGPIYAHAGWPSLAYDEVALVGQLGERMLSRAQNREYEAGGSGGGGFVFNYAPVVHAIDARGVDKILEKHGRTLVQVINKQINDRGQGIGSGRY